ncbi:MAG: TraB/GumN family protein [Methanobacteriaceae archaeon]|nr:TraB/GumN family protein [Methanobacteriaceae archaeon]
MEIEHLKIIGTAHVSKNSMEEVKEIIHAEKPDVVAVELDVGRYQKLMREKLGLKEDDQFSVKDLMRGENISLFLISGLLTYLQNKIGDELGVKPGSEMLAAIEAAEEVGAKIALIDRDIRITMQRIIDSMSLREKLRFLFNILLSFFKKDEIEDVESLKSEDTLDEVMEYFKDISPQAYHVLVDERDAYMARKLLEIPEDKVVAVVGAGHKKGIKHYLQNPEKIPPLTELLSSKRHKSTLRKLVLIIPLLLIVPFVLAFLSGVNIQGDILKFVLLTGGFAFIGSLVAGSRLKSALVAFLVAPMTVLHPLLAAGWFAGLMEAKLRNISFGDLENLNKCNSLRELWENNLFRVMLVVAGANLGCSIGTFLTIPQIILPMIGKIIGAG